MLIGNLRRRCLQLRLMISRVRRRNIDVAVAQSEDFRNEKKELN